MITSLFGTNTKPARAISEEVGHQFKALWHLIGNTPMLALDYDYMGKRKTIFVKCGQYNLTGSIKDRMALYILFQAARQSQIKSGETIIEATSGKTGIAFAAIGKALGHTFKIIMPDVANYLRFHYNGLAAYNQVKVNAEIILRSV